MRAVIGAVSFAALVAASPILSTETIHKDAAPILSSTNAQTIDDSYIVVFKKHVDAAKAADHHLWVQDVHLDVQSQREELRKRGLLSTTEAIFEGLRHTYDISGSFLGYAGHFDKDVIEQVRRHPDVEYIEKDSTVHTMDDGQTENGAPWGLARISHRKTLSFGSFNKYLYAADAGEGVDVYVIDTGTNTEHVDFEGRAHWGKTIPTGDADEDGNGHGTHCSGTVAGKKYGVAKKANVYAVKVLRSNGSGSMSDVIKGVEYAVEAHTEKVKSAKASKNKKFKGSAANMSLGGGKSSPLDAAVNAAVDAGIHFAVAAGNDNADSCNYSPAAAANAVTVGASTVFDERAYFSNFGKCNDIFAPGLDVQSTWIGSKYAVNTISGTSMASPHIAGLLAYYLSLQPSSDSAYAVAELTPKKLKATLISVGTKGALSEVPSSTTNILAWNGGGSSNFSEIVAQGGYTVNEVAPVTQLSEVEEELEKEFKIASATLVKGAGSVASKVEEVSEKIYHLVDEELKHLIEEIQS